MSAALPADFTKAAEEVRNLQTKPSNEELLELYALYKQGSQDPPLSESPKPGMLDLTGKAKRKAWEKLEAEGVTPEQAQKAYVEKVAALKEKYGMKE